MPSDRSFNRTDDGLFRAYLVAFFDEIMAPPLPRI
jgi:hypothetical protein